MDDALLTKYLLRETTAEESAAVLRWISANPDHEEHYARLRRIWETSRLLANSSSVDVEKAWLRFVQLRDQADGHVSARSSTIMLRRWLRMAAVLVLISAAAFSGYYFLSSSQTQWLGKTYEATDAASMDTLADGTIITLNTHASLLFSQGPFQRNRLVKLRSGDVFFQVAPNADKPFVIQSGNVTITVLGTSFHVKRSGAETAVTVKSGKVRVEGLNRTVELTAKQQIIVNTLTQRFDVGVSNQLVLDRTPLWRIAELLEAAYNVEVTVVGNDISHLPMTTTFSDDTLDNVLIIISKTLGVTVEKKGNHVIFR